MLKKGIFALALFIAMPLYAAEYWIDVRIPEQYQREKCCLIWGIRTR